MSSLTSPEPKRPIFRMLTPVTAEWECQRSGDCCRLPKHVIVSESEANLLIAWAEKQWPIVRLRSLSFGRDQPGFLRLNAGPCPFLEGKATCTVYPIRPYNCRRFSCFRPDVQREPLVMDVPAPISQFRSIGCANLRERLMQSRIARRLYDTIQRKAQRWARQHGWSDDAAK